MNCGRLSRRLGLAAFALVLSACNGGGLPSSGPAGFSLPTQATRVQQMPMESEHRHKASGKIQHVVIIVQENRSFNNLFYGFKGATYATYGYDSNGNKVTLNPIPLETNWDVEHDSWGFEAACNGT